MLTNKNNLLVGSRIFFALLGFSAVVTEIATLSERGRFVPMNFFSYFTVEANLIAVVILVLSALIGDRQGDRLTMLRGSSALNMIVVGIVFSLLLAGLDVELTAVPWDNTVLHYIMPVFVTLDWFVDLPKTRVAFKRVLIWMVFPIFYVIYSLLRGHFTAWYPYPFLNSAVHGYAGVGIVILAIAIVSAVIIWLLVRFSRHDILLFQERRRARCKAGSETKK